MKQKCNRFIDRILAGIHSRSRQQSTRTVELILAGHKLNFLDVGAAGGQQSRWKQYYNSIDYVLVEPDERSRNELHELFGTSTLIVDKALWGNAGSIQINLCNDTKQSSVYKPNMDLLKKYQFPERYLIDSNVSVDCSTIDELLYKSDIVLDFMKLDIQGAELQVLIGGELSLSSVLCLEIEVEFSRLYLDQPLADEIFVYMRKNGFEFLDFVHINRWERTAYSGLGQTMFADAVFIQSPDKIVGQVSDGTMSVEMGLKFIALLYMYRRYDLALHVLRSLILNGKIEKERGKRIDFLVSRQHKKLGRIQTLVLYVNRIIDEDSNKEPGFPSIHLQL